jgi:signal transduction histidine kinase
MADIGRGELGELLEDALRDVRGGDSQSVRSIGLEIRVGSASRNWTETIGSKVTRAHKPRFEKLAREIRNEQSVAQSLESTGEVEVDLSRRDLSSRDLPAVRYFYGQEEALTVTADDDAWSFNLRGWAFTSARSSTPFTPQLLRARFERLKGAVQAKFASPSREIFTQAIRGGAMREALEVLAAVYGLEGLVLWIFDETDRRYRSLASVGTRQPFNVPVRRSDLQNRIGIVSQIRPNRKPVLYDAEDRSLWRPAVKEDWRPFDLDFFKARNWRSCIAIPIVCAGRLVGALSAYSAKSAQSLQAIEEDLIDCASLCAEAIFVRREVEVISSLATRYDEELLTANVSLSALSLSHDVLHYYKAVEQAVTEAQAYVKTDQMDLALENMAGAAAMIKRTEPALEAMRKLANEARAPRSDKKRQQTQQPGQVLMELEPLLRSILPHFSKSEDLDPAGVSVQIKGSPRPVCVAPLTLERITVNLCVNAAQWRARTISVVGHFERSEDEFQLVVRDDGQGIAPWARDLVFDRFFSERGGSGLGLYVVKNLATRVEGEVHLQSYDDSDQVDQVGTVVTVVLPTA